MYYITEILYKCDFGTFSKNIYENHKNSDKHLKFEERQRNK